MFADYADHYRSCFRCYKTKKGITWLLAHGINTHQKYFPIQWLLLPQMRHKHTKTQVNAKVFLIQNICIYLFKVCSFVLFVDIFVSALYISLLFQRVKINTKIENNDFFCAFVTFFVLNQARIENNNSFETAASNFELIAKVVSVCSCFVEVFVRKFSIYAERRITLSTKHRDKDLMKISVVWFSLYFLWKEGGVWRLYNMMMY